MGAQVTAVQNRMSKLGRNAAKNAKRSARRLKHSQTLMGSKIHLRCLLKDFDKTLDEDTQERAKSFEGDEMPPSQEERGSQAPLGPRHKPASSEARFTSVLDHVGRRLTERDLRLKLERIKAEKEQRWHPSPIRSHRDEEQEAESGASVERRLRQNPPPPPPPPPSQRASNVDRVENRKEEERIGDLRMDDLRRLSVQMENEKKAPAPVTTPSPFTQDIKDAHLPAVYRFNGDLTFNGNTDPAEYMICFNIEMEVYQVPNLTRCRLFVASMRGRTQQWFSKIGQATIGSWEHMGDLFLKQFQSSMLYAPPVATLANVKQYEGETLQDYFKRFNAEVPLARGATDEAIKNFLIVGLRRGSKFWKSLQVSEPATLAELYQQAEHFKRVEKSMMDLRQEEKGNSYRGRGGKRERSRSPKGKGKTYKERSPSPKRYVRRTKNELTIKDEEARPYNNIWRTHTPLVAPIDHIYAMYASKGMFKKATPRSY